MKKTKLVLVMVLGILMAAALFAGCQTAQKTEEKSDWDYIADKGEMIVGITYYEPMNYLDAEGNLVGFDTEFTNALCEELGVTPKFIVINWDTKEVELSSKNIDCIWNGLTVMEERRENMDFSQSYIKNMQVAVIRKADAAAYPDIASMADAKLTAESGSAGEAAIKDDAILNQANYVGVTYQSNALLEVKSGTADIAVIDYVMAKAMVGEGTDYSDLMIVPGIELAVEEYAIGFRVGSTVTLEKVNAAINKLIQNGKLNEIAQKYDLADSLLANQ